MLTAVVGAHMSRGAHMMSQMGEVTCTRNSN